MEVESAMQERSSTGLKTWPGKIKARFIKVAKSVKKLGKDDPRRIIHSLKVGLALTLVSLVYYSRTLYDSFGIAGMWAVLTVVVVFEFTVGGTLGKSLNRGVATLLAGVLGVGAVHLASFFGGKGEPIVIGIIVFLLAAAATFTRFFPRIKARYDYGVLIFILTFSMVSVSGYRVEELLQLAHQRLSTIVIGGATCIIVSICICPVWAGEELHKLVTSNTEKLASYLEGFADVYFQDGDSTLMESNNKDKSFLLGYKSVLNSKSTEESMANLARWEPRHGKFKLRHPWKQYLKVGALLRQCAYQIEALNSYISSDIQAPEDFLSKIQEPCTKMSGESAKALKCLASAIKTMTDPSSATTHLEEAKTAVRDLKIALEVPPLDADLLAIVPAATVTLILIEIVKCVEKLSESVHELANLANFKKGEANVSPEKPQLLHRGIIKPVLDGDCSADHVVITVHETTTADSPEKNYQSNPETSKSSKNQEL